MSVGLGLGDFCGVIAVCRESGGESVVADADGERYTPSVVSIGDGRVVVSLRTCKVFPPSLPLACSRAAGSAQRCRGLFVHHYVYCSDGQCAPSLTRRV
jgi:hypothetical protein